MNTLFNDLHIRISIWRGQLIPVEISLGVLTDSKFMLLDSYFQEIPLVSDYNTSKIGLNNDHRIFHKVTLGEAIILTKVFTFEAHDLAHTGTAIRGLNTIDVHYALEYVMDQVIPIKEKSIIGEL